MDTPPLDFDIGIYAITAPSGRQYIGSAVSFAARWKLHLINLRAPQTQRFNYSWR